MSVWEALSWVAVGALVGGPLGWCLHRTGHLAASEARLRAEVAEAVVRLAEQDALLANNIANLATVVGAIRDVPGVSCPHGIPYGTACPTCAEMMRDLAARN